MKKVNRYTHFGAAVLATALFCVALFFGSPSTLKAADSGGAATGSKQAMSIDQRIAGFHDKLKITPAQDEQWNKLAQVMRENGVAMQAANQTRKEKGKMNAVDDLKSYSQVLDVQAEGMHKFIPAFEALYATMSDDQKKNADTVFTHHLQKKMKKK